MRLDTGRPRIAAIAVHFLAAMTSAVGRILLGVGLTLPFYGLPVVPVAGSIWLSRSLNAMYLFGFLDFCLYWCGVGSVYAFDAYAARARHFAMRTEVSAVLATDATVSAKLQSCAEAVMRRMEGASVGIWIATPGDGVLRLTGNAGIHTTPHGAQASSPGLDEAIARIARSRTRQVTSELVGYPLVIGDDGVVIGVLAIVSRTPIDQGTGDTLGAIADTLAYGIQRARGEAALRQSEAFLAAAQRLSSTGSFLWRMDTDTLTWSDELYHIYEFDHHVPLTPDFAGTRVHPDDVAVWSGALARARTMTSLTLDYRLLMPDRSIKHLHAVAHAIPTADGHLEYLGAIQDVTHQRLSEQALDKLRAELAHVARVTSLGALTASVAHEISQPLSGIITNAGTCLRMLDATPPNVDGARDTARRTMRDGTRASEVVTRLRAMFSKKEFTLEQLDLNEAVREVVALSSGELQRNRVVVQPELAGDLPSITGDRVQLQQVILNLLRNASDAMAEVHDRPRHLCIRTERDGGDRVRLTVRDAGIGFDLQSVDRLFEAFYTSKSDGMGIGLSVSRSIVERHHGRLWAESHDGSGATFAFSIPHSPRGVGAETNTKVQ